MTIPDDIRVCAFCPNVCRARFPPGDEPPETIAPSALSYLAYAAASGFVATTPEVVRTLRRLEVVEACRPACSFGFDIPASLRRLTQALESV